MTLPEALAGSACVARSRSNDTKGMRASPKRRTTISTGFSLFAEESRQTGRQRAEFLRSELALCFTFLFVAAVRYEVGAEESAKGSLANAEEVYSSVLPFVSDPSYSKCLTKEAMVEFTAGLRLLRERLDGLKRLRN
jgi:hypothetical protein